MSKKSEKNKKDDDDDPNKEDPYAYTSGDSEPERSAIFKNISATEKKIWIDQLWRRVISKTRAGALIIRSLNDLNKEIYLYGR